MIYLIGGPPRCGKTKLATRLSKKIAVTLFPGDEIEGIARPYVCDNDYPKLFPKNILRENTSNSNDLMYSKYSSQEILDAYLGQAKTIQIAIEVIIETMIRTGQNLIIEGYHLTPEYIDKMKAKYGKSNFKEIFLIKKSNVNALETIRASKDEDDWVHTKTTNQNIHNKIADFIVLYSDYIEKECNKYQLKHLDYTGSLDSHLNSAFDELI